MDENEEDRKPATPTAVTSMMHFQQLMQEFGDAPVVIQFTAVHCRRCVTLKKELAEAFDASLKWITVDVGELHELQEQFNVVQLPRFDVHCRGRTESAESFDATVATPVAADV